jgi:hypothetical protein
MPATGLVRAGGSGITTRKRRAGTSTAWARCPRTARQAVPDPDVALYEFTGAMHDNTQTAPPDSGNNGPADGDPVDLRGSNLVQDRDLRARPGHAQCLRRAG